MNTKDRVVVIENYFDDWVRIDSREVDLEEEPAQKITELRGEKPVNVISTTIALTKSKEPEKNYVYYTKKQYQQKQLKSSGAAIKVNQVEKQAQRSTLRNTAIKELLSKSAAK